MLLPAQLAHSTVHAAGQRQKLLSGEHAGHAAAACSAVILTELSLQFGLSCGRRQVGVTELPEQQGWRCREILFFSFCAAVLLLRCTELPFVFALGSLHNAGCGLSKHLLYSITILMNLTDWWSLHLDVETNLALIHGEQTCPQL